MNDFDNELFNTCLVKLANEAKRNQEVRKYVENKRQREAIYKAITKDIKFISKFVKKCQNRQTGDKTVFYDIDIVKCHKKILGESSVNYIVNIIY